MRSTLLCILSLSWLCACAESEPQGVTPYRLGQALVIGESEGGELTSVNAACDTDACNAVRERCGSDAYADVVLDDSGNVADVLCFRGNLKVEEIGLDTVGSARAGNNTVLVFDAEDDGDDVTGDVVLEGNNSVVYGKGADVSVIGGSLSIVKNNAIVRGVSIAGDLVIDKNNAQLSFTEIHGDLTIAGNNTTLAECVVHGQVRISGNNTVLVRNQFASTGAITGKNLTCNDNVRFVATDAADAGGVSEFDAEVSCGDAR